MGVAFTTSSACAAAAPQSGPHTSTAVPRLSARSFAASVSTRAASRSARTSDAAFS